VRQIKCAAVLKFFKPADAGFFTPIGSRLIFWRPAKNRISNRVYTEKGETKTGYRSAAHAKRYAMTPNNTVPVADIRQLIDRARQRAAAALNAELTLLYWRVGGRIHREILGNRRAGYGKAIVSTLSKQLTIDYGPGFSSKNLHHMVRFAQVFPDEAIVYSVSRQLSWTHLRTLIYLDAPLKRDFYLELCRLENWSVRQLQERMNA